MCVCVCVNDTFCVCGCVVKLVCVRVIQVFLYLAFGGRRDEYVELFCHSVCLYYIVLKNSITGQKQCNSFHLCSKG